jgi:transcriptional regulator with XRE-family HTH domain
MAGENAVQTDYAALQSAMGRVVTACRETAGMETRAALARALGVTAAYIGRIEAGKENLTLETLSRIVASLNTPMPEFLRMAAEELRRPSAPKPPRAGRPRTQ